MIIITGGSEGLGKAIATKLASDNQVVICALNEEKLKATSSEIGCDYFICDVTNNDQIESMVKEVVKKYGRIDVLINNAGLWIQGELDSNDSVQIKRLFEVNTVGTILYSRAVIPQMKKQQAGWILNIISQAGFYGKAERSIYNASKWAITGFTKSLEPELSKHGIKVVGLYPGMMKTDIFKKIGVEKNTSNGLDTADVAKIIEFIISFDNSPLTFPEIGFKHINQ